MSVLVVIVGWQQHVVALDVGSTPTSLTTTLGVQRVATLASTGGTGTVTYTATVINPSVGLTVTPTVSGTTLTVASSGAAGTATVRITGQDTVGATDTHDIPITVNAAIAVTSAPTSLTTTLGVSRTATLSATGGTGVITYSATVVGPSAGLTITPTVSGSTLTVASSGAAGTATVRITGQDTVGATDTHDIPITVNAAIAVTSAPTSLTTTLGVSRTATLSATGGTGVITYSATVVGPSAGLTITPTVSGSTLTVASSGAAGTATVRITGQDTLGALSNPYEIPITVNPVVTVNIVTPTDDTVLMNVSGTEILTLTTGGGTGNKTLMVVEPLSGPTITILGNQVTVVAPATAGGFNLKIRATDQVGATAEVTREFRVADLLRWSPEPSGSVMLVRTGATSARQTSLPCDTAGGHTIKNTTITQADGSAVPAFLSVSRSGAVLNVGLNAGSAGTAPNDTTSYPLKITVNDNKNTIEAVFTVVWFVNQTLTATGPGALSYPVANPGYLGVLNGTTYSDPAATQPGAPDLCWANGLQPLVITCERVVSTTAPLAAWAVNQDELLCRSSQSVFVDGSALRLGGTTQVATWAFDAGAGRLTITCNDQAALGGVALVNQMLACVAFTNPAGTFATSSGTPRRVAVTVTVSDARGINRALTVTRTINFTSQPPSFEQVVAEPEGRTALALSGTPSSTDLTCAVVAAPVGGRITNAAGNTLSSFPVSEVIAGNVFYRNVDSTLLTDPFTLEVTDSGGTSLGNVGVAVSITQGNALALLGAPLLHATPAGATTIWNAQVSGPRGNLVTHSIIPWYGVTDPATITGISVSSTPVLLQGPATVPVTLTWADIDATVVVGGVPVTTYPPFLRFRLRAESNGVVVEQACLVRVLGPGAPSVLMLEAAN